MLPLHYLSKVAWEYEYLIKTNFRIAEDLFFLQRLLYQSSNDKNRRKNSIRNDNLTYYCFWPLKLRSVPRLSDLFLVSRHLTIPKTWRPWGCYILWNVFLSWIRSPWGPYSLFAADMSWWQPRLGLEASTRSSKEAAEAEQWYVFHEYLSINFQF